MRYFRIFKSFIDSILINESNVIYSPDFKKVLIKMGHPIAEELLKIEGVDKPVRSNYFDLKPDTNDTITFITDRKQKELSQKITWGKYELSKFDILTPKEENRKYYDNLDMEMPSEVNEVPVGEIGEVHKMWTSPRSGKVWCKFVPDNKEYGPIMVNMVNLKKTWDDDVFFKQNRQDIRIGRALRGLLDSVGIKFTDKDIEEFVNKWKSTIDRINDIFSNFEIVSGQEITHWYHCDNYYNDRGTLGSSCMREANSDFFDIYVLNKNIQLVIYKSIDDESKIMGRALLWTFDDGRKFMDRIYTSNDSDVELFRQFAKEKGFYCKYYNNSSSNLRSFSPDGSVVDLGSIDIKLEAIDHDYYPYLDTFKYYQPKTGIISSDPDGRSGFITLESTDGLYDGDPDEDDYRIYVEYYGRSIDRDDLVNCDWADFIGSRISEDPNNFIEDWRFTDDCFYSEFYDKWVSYYLSQRIGKICHETDEWRLKEDMARVHGKNFWISKDYDGDDYKYSKHLECWIPSEMAFQVDGDWRVQPNLFSGSVDDVNKSNESVRLVTRFQDFKK